MKGIVKGVILLAILAIPVVIYVFLKLFGSNEFSIPVYYAQGVKAPFHECVYKGVPYVVNTGRYKGEKANVTVFFRENNTFQANDLTNIQRRLVAVFPDDFTFTPFGLRPQEIGEITVLDSMEFKRSMHCDFVTDTLNQFILHDRNGVIRGYYSTDLAEVDRLIVETKILLEDE